MWKHTTKTLKEVKNGRTLQQWVFNYELTRHIPFRTLRSTAQTWNTHAMVISRPSVLNIGQTADVLWTNHLALRRGQTKTETDEDGDSGRQGQTHSGDERKPRRHPGVNTVLDTSLMRPADSRAREGCSSLRSPRSCRGTTSPLSFLNLLPVKRRIMKR